MKVKHFSLNSARRYVRGDTIPPFYLTLESITDGSTIVPTYICCQLRSNRGQLVYEYLPIVSDDDRILFEAIPSTVTQGLIPGTYRYDVEFRMSNGVVETRMVDSVEIII